MSVMPPDSPNATAERPSSGLTWFALLVALVAVAGSLWLSLGMNLKACPLCFYQRTFAMAVFGVLVVDAVRNGRSRRFVGPALLTAVLLGVAFGYAGIKSVPPPPKTPKDAPLDGCRPPYRAE